MAERISNQVLEQPERIVARDNIIVDGCQVQGILELQADHVQITNCVFYGTEEPGIRFTLTNQNGVRLLGNNWPQNAVTEINYGRSVLQSRGYIDTEPMLVAPRAVIECLDTNLANTDITYRRFLLMNRLLSSVYGVEGGENIILIVPETGEDIDNTYRNTLFAVGPSETKNKFSDDVSKKAWKLLEEYMSSIQYFAFMEGNKIELQNKTNDFRLLIDKKGDFVILEGKTGEGVVATSGRIKSYNYPLGDEIAAFLDWFKFKTKELISQWNCGTYGIVKEGQRR